MRGKGSESESFARIRKSFVKVQRQFIVSTPYTVDTYTITRVLNFLFEMLNVWINKFVTLLTFGKRSQCKLFAFVERLLVGLVGWFDFHISHLSVSSGELKAHPVGGELSG